MGVDTDFADALEQIEEVAHIRRLMEELRSGLAWYWEAAGGILAPCDVRLKAPETSFFSLKKNFFSLLFLYSYFRAGIPPRRRVLYAATLQCLRGMVTGCDNLLDNEYKATLDTDIPATGYRFRSVVDIMVSDRVLFQILMAAAEKNEIGLDQVLAASAASMKTMTRSGVEEASEEAGVSEILAPDVVIQTIHHLKTGMLFQCPWDIPQTIESVPEKLLSPLLDGLYRIGMGCQIMDDMVDMANDMQSKRHNYLVSLVHHGTNPAEKKRLADLRHGDKATHLARARCADHYPDAFNQAADLSDRLLDEGLGMLFGPDHQSLVKPAISFLKKRIGIPQSMGRSEA